jgi:hypothetical protein
VTKKGSPVDRMIAAIPGDYGDMVNQYPRLAGRCTPDDYNARTALENALWIIETQDEIMNECVHREDALRTRVDALLEETLQAERRLQVERKAR